MRSRIEDAAMELIGVVPDDIVFALPHVIPKTPAGQIKHGASRELYERQIRQKAAPPVAHSTMLTYCFLMLCPFSSWRWGLARRATKTLFAVTGVPIAVKGRENLPPEHQPCIFVCNHSSYFDGFILMQVAASILLRGQSRPGPSIFRQDILKPTRYDFRQPVRQGKRNQGCHQYPQALAGKSFLFFPGGTFTRRPGLLQFHLGAFVTACDTELPIVPITIRGARSLLRDGSWLPRHVGVSVTIHSPIDPNRFIRNSNQSDRLSAILALRDAVRELMLKQLGEPDPSREEPPV